MHSYIAEARSLSVAKRRRSVVCGCHQHPDYPRLILKLNSMQWKEMFGFALIFWTKWLNWAKEHTGSEVKAESISDWIRTVNPSI